MEEARFQNTHDKLTPGRGSTWSFGERIAVNLKQGKFALGLDTARSLICNWERLALEPAQDKLALGPDSVWSLVKKLALDLAQEELALGSHL